MGRANWLASTAASTALMCILATNSQAGQEIYANMLLELKKLIEQQQKQLDNQSKEIAKLKEQLGGVTGEIDKKADKEELVKPETEKMVTSKSENVDVSLYGQLNRGILWSDNGAGSDVYFVDNSNSQSRLGLNAAVSPSETYTVGGRIEYGIKSNATTDVGQGKNNGATSVNWNLRWADISFDFKSYGKVYLGHGSTASDGTSEIDLSGTGVVAYSDVEALSGGQIWYDGISYESDPDDPVFNLMVKDVFNNMDGLGRDDRLRYDSPSFAGLSFMAGAVSGDAYDASIRYSRELGDTKVASAIAWAKTGDAIDAEIDNQYNGSISILLGNGLNATFAAGIHDMSNELRNDPTTWYGKLGYRVDFCSLGKTSFSVDYGEDKYIASDSENVKTLEGIEGKRNVNLINQKAKTWSLAVVQNIPSWGTELYLAYRNYQLNAAGDGFDDINAVLGGARVKF